MNEFAPVQELSGHLSGIDFIIVCRLSCFFLLFHIFLDAGKKIRTIFFSAAGKFPPLAACLSFVATEVSALTIIGVPATAYSENWEYLQFFLGSAAAKISVAFLFIPVFYKYNCTSIYEFLRYRFGPRPNMQVRFFS